MKASKISLIRDYYYLTKPGIIRGNLLTAAAGFFLASQGDINSGRFAAILTGTSLVIACGCVLNNYIDRHIDKKMTRTRKRALVTGKISKWQALGYAAGLGLLGFEILILYTNMLTTLIGLMALFCYVVLYGTAKRRSVHGTIVGSLPGAASIVAGYSAVSGRLDTAALLLFLIMVTWQMPHFYAIGLYRLADYKAAGLPILPVHKGVRAAKIQILCYIAAFTAAAAALSLFGYTGPAYLITVLLLGLGWFGLGYNTFSATDSTQWGRTMFLCSLVVITVLCLAISLDSFF